MRNTVLKTNEDIEVLTLRAVALYRASTKQQTSKDDNDLPTQRKIVQDYIFNNDYHLVREFTEGGVSGFKNLSTEREAILSILDMAKRKEFDILVVYHSNRLGRLQDDTPLLIKQLNKYGVRVISTLEGELKAHTPMDRLMNNIRFFGNEQESVLKSEVISDYHIAMVEEGRFRGGSMIPYGYKLEDRGSKNFKGKHIQDFIINEEEAEIVKTIYDLSINMNYGQSRIARYLNDKKIPSKKGGVWHASSVQQILNNTIYKGVFHYNSKVREKEVLSPIVENIIIISPEKWEENQRKMKARQYEKKGYQVDDLRTSKNTYGKMLLNGLAVCGHCGMALTTMTAYTKWTTSDGEKHKKLYYKYRCASFYKKGGIKCEGQSTYCTNVIEPDVEEMVISFVNELEGRELQKDFIKNIDKKIDDLVKDKKQAKNDIEKNYQRLKVLKDEFVKVLMRESDSNKEMVNNLIAKTELDIKDIELSINEIEQNILQLKSDKNIYIELEEDFINFEDKYRNSDLEHKRAMLKKVIDKVIIYRDEIQVKFHIMVETYKLNSAKADECKDDHSIRTRRGTLHFITLIEETRTKKLVS